MTEQQVEALKEKINQKYYGDKMTIPSNLKRKISKRDKLLLKEVKIMEMMLACLAYNDDYFEIVKASWYVANRNPGEYDWEELEALGIKDGKAYIKKLWEEMKADFKTHARIKWNVYTDSDGQSYNSVEWN